MTAHQEQLEALAAELAAAQAATAAAAEQASQEAEGLRAEVGAAHHHSSKLEAEVSGTQYLCLCLA